MFDLDTEIAFWRRQVEEALDSKMAALELECHLREEIDRQILSGLSYEQGFRNALATMGEIPAIREEFIRSDDRFFGGVRRFLGRRMLVLQALCAVVLGIIGVIRNLWILPVFFYLS